MNKKNASGIGILCLALVSLFAITSCATDAVSSASKTAKATTTLVASSAADSVSGASASQSMSSGSAAGLGSDATSGASLAVSGPSGPGSTPVDVTSSASVASGRPTPGASGHDATVKNEEKDKGDDVEDDD